MKIAAAGKHLLIEKPVMPTYQSWETVRDHAASRNVKLAALYNQMHLESLTALGFIPRQAQLATGAAITVQFVAWRSMYSKVGARCSQRVF